MTEEYIVPDTMFITKEEAKEHLEKNKHHYSSKAHTYAMTAWRSPSVKKLFEILMNADWEILNRSEFVPDIKEIDYENLAKVTYAYGVVSQDYGSDADLEWEEIEEYSTDILNKWHKYKDIQNVEEEGYIIPYAIRKWEEYMDNYTK